MLTILLELAIAALHLAVMALSVLMIRWGLDISTPEKDIDSLSRFLGFDTTGPTYDTPEHRWDSVTISEDVTAKYDSETVD